ncbi:MAG: apolipoprotein N-acyltransferase, partial [Thermodesulfobacteriota bacterium]
AVGLFLLLAIYLAFYMGVFAAVYAGLRNRPALRILAAPVAWTGLEYVRSFLLSGFPWEPIGCSQYRVLPLIQMADLTGVYGISFLIVLANSLLAWAASRLPERKSLTATEKAGVSALFILFLIMAGSAWLYGAWRLTQVSAIMTDAPKKKVAVVQGNIDQNQKWDFAFRDATVEKYLALCRRAAVEGPDLVVLPETAMPFYFLYDAEATRKVLETARETGAWFLAGAPAAAGENGVTEYYNSAYLITPQGRVAGRYDKTHLVPFGEFVPLGPLREWLPFVRTIVAAAGDFTAGKVGRTLDLDGLPLGVQICYEIIFPYQARRVVQNGAGLIVNITNDAWYGRTSAPWQHFSMVVFRAVETRRAVVRSANTGVSGYIAPTGRMVGATPLFVESVKTWEVPVMRAMTVYSRYGDLFAKICLVGFIGILWYIFRPGQNGTRNTEASGPRRR